MEFSQYIILWSCLGALIFYCTTKYIHRWKLKKRMQIAKKGELKAIKFLEKNGYEVLDTQKQSQYIITVNDKSHRVTVKADAIVKKGNKIYIAEVKTGEKAPSPQLTATRRQLLEYYMVYKPDGILLVDMEKQIIKRVGYSFLQGPRLWQKLFTKVFSYMIILLCGIVIGFLSRGD